MAGNSEIAPQTSTHFSAINFVQIDVFRLYRENIEIAKDELYVNGNIIHVEKGSKLGLAL